MIRDDPHARPDIDEIVLETIGSGHTSRFCCPECMSEYIDEGIFRRFHASATMTAPGQSSVAPSTTHRPKMGDAELDLSKSNTETITLQRKAEGTLNTTKDNRQLDIASSMHNVGAMLLPPSFQTGAMPPPVLGKTEFGVLDGDDPEKERDQQERNGTVPYELKYKLNGNAVPSISTMGFATSKSANDAKNVESVVDTNSSISESPTLFPVSAGNQLPLSTSHPRPAKPGTGLDKKSDATAAVERDATSAFRNFAVTMRADIVQSRKDNAAKNKEIKNRDLKKFASSFKLHTPIPSDLVVILTKEPSKQIALQEAAKRNAEASEANNASQGRSLKSHTQNLRAPTYTANIDRAKRPAAVSGSLPYITEMSSRTTWSMPTDFDWTEIEMLKLIMLKRFKPQKEFRKAISTASTTFRLLFDDRDQCELGIPAEKRNKC